MENKTLIIGCGGSGIQTLIRLNAMFAGNSNCIEDMYEDLVYITVDTDKKDTSKLEAAVKDQMSGANPPLIHSFFLPGNSKFPTLESIVITYFNDKKRKMDIPDGYERLKEFWWHCPNEEGEPGKGEPFRGYRLNNYITGASQCGAASFMATWLNLPKFKREMEKVCNESLRRRNSGGSWNIYIVAGTAGGTGRGCWWLVAYKIYQCLLEILPDGAVNVPKGIFFDASCFDSVDDDGPVDAIRKKINSLTAYSELSAWLELTKRDGYQFSLPDLSSPDNSTESDVVHVRERSAGGLGVEKSPVRSAFIITKKNQDGVSLENPQEYYDMAAASLYAMIAEKSVASASNNRPEPIGSFASCTFELDTNKLNLFLKNEVQRVFAKFLSSHSVAGDEMDNDADMIIGNPYSAYDENSTQDNECFFAKTGFDASDSIAEVVLRGVSTSRLLPTLMQDICEGLLRNQKDKKGNDTGEKEFAYTPKFVSWLEAQDVKKAQDYASRALLLEELDINDILAKWSPAGKTWTLNINELKKKINDTILYSFTCGGDKSASLGRALAVATKFRNYFEFSYNNLTGNGKKILIQVENSTISSIEDAQRVFKAIIQRMASDNPLLAFGTPFQKNEIKNLRKQFQTFIRCAIFFKLQNPLAKKFKDAVTFVDKIIASLNDMMTLLEDVEKCFDVKLCNTFDNRLTRSGIYEELFVRDDNDSILASLKPSNSSQNIFHRILMPIMNPKDIEDMIESSQRVLSSDTIKNELTEVFNDFVNKKYKSVENAIDSGLLDSIMTLIENNVFFDERTFSTTFNF